MEVPLRVPYSAQLRPKNPPAVRPEAYWRIHIEPSSKAWGPGAILKIRFPSLLGACFSGNVVFAWAWRVRQEEVNLPGESPGAPGTSTMILDFFQLVPLKLMILLTQNV